ncbi:NADPH-dependent F420 reductase [Paenibacillus sp. XY044]|uniref:NADPH-dependent F420 reductase n=1 Tax=Paenibacillus sp. XY044 TaxID=2026089 RepID=UPI000B999F3F|nr:NAD(P)-binding domain-containing protein [Paenibacillus sp. XY044]OZB92414.1 hypothetical protein CJP46_26215 [Paenibacillus sp. XY044]
MNISVIGAGNVGSALGHALHDAGHCVVYGVRDPESSRYQDLRESGKTSLTTIVKAVEDSTVILLAVPWQAAKETVELIHNWDGKILIDCTNPIKPDFSGLEFEQGLSGAEQIALWANGARVVKCFNQTGADNMIHPNYQTSKMLMFAAGDEHEAVETAIEFAKQIGFDAVSAGKLHISRQLEELAWLWIHLAIKEGWGTSFAFALMKR